MDKIQQSFKAPLWFVSTEKEIDNYENQMGQIVGFSKDWIRKQTIESIEEIAKQRDISGKDLIKLRLLINASITLQKHRWYKLRLSNWDTFGQKESLLYKDGQIIVEQGIIKKMTEAIGSIFKNHDN